MDRCCSIGQRITRHRLKAETMTPTPTQVRRLREKIQKKMDLGITEAQDWCAEALHTSRRAFQQWEAKEGTPSHRAMHGAFWELLNLKVKQEPSL